MKRIDPEYQLLLHRGESRRGSYRKLIRRLIKTAPPDLLPRFALLHREAFEEIDCLSCANCCAEVGPRLNDTDVNRLARALSIKPGELKRQYLKIDEDGDTVFREHPCPLLMADNRCLVYESRPKACREYPHTDDPAIHSLLKLTLANSRFCPAVVLIFEGLCERYGG